MATQMLQDNSMGIRRKRGRPPHDDIQTRTSDRAICTEHTAAGGLVARCAEDSALIHGQ